MWDGFTPLRLLGISLTELTHEEESQLSLFPDEGKEKRRKLDKTMDALRQKFGNDTIVRATSYHSDMQVGKKYRAQMENKTESDN